MSHSVSFLILMEAGATHGHTHVDRLFQFAQHMVTSKWDPAEPLEIMFLRFQTR